jgi:hypothetical protein
MGLKTMKEFIETLTGLGGFMIGLGVTLACIVVVVFMLLFRGEIRDWMRRVRKMGGAELAPPQQQAAIGAAQEGHQVPALANQAPLLDPGLEFWQSSIEADIDRLGLRGNNALLIEQLKYALAVVQRVNHFHRVGRLIFGTQIAVLKMLDANRAGLTLDDLRPVFGEHEGRVAESNVGRPADFLGWINYPLNMGLTSFRDGRYHLNEVGRSFLIFAGENQLSEALAF